MENRLALPTITALTVALAACGIDPRVPTHAPAEPVVPASTPTDTFLVNVASLCGKAFAGTVIANTPAPTGADPFAGKPLVMHVRECSGDGIRIPFHVGEDRSRAWVLTRTGSGLRLKHDHRHADGSDDAITMYGGDTADAGSAIRQEFPVDAESVAMFTAADMHESNSNTWAMELRPDEAFVYELARPGGRLFRVQFDLTAPVAAPPPPWGSES